MPGFYKRYNTRDTTVTAPLLRQLGRVRARLRLVDCERSSAPLKSQNPQPPAPRTPRSQVRTPPPLAPPRDRCDQHCGDPQDPPTPHPPTPRDPSLHVLAITCDSFSPTCTYTPKLEWKPPRLEVPKRRKFELHWRTSIVRRTRAAHSHISESADEPASDEHGTCHLAERTEGTCGIIDSRRPAAQAGRAGVLDPRPHLPSHADWAGASRDSRG